MLSVAAEQLPLGLDVRRVVALLPPFKLVPDGEDLGKLVIEPLAPGCCPVNVLIGLLARPRLLLGRAAVVGPMLACRRPGRSAVAEVSAPATLLTTNKTGSRLVRVRIVAGRSFGSGPSRAETGSRTVSGRRARSRRSTRSRRREEGTEGVLRRCTRRVSQESKYTST